MLGGGKLMWFENMSGHVKYATQVKGAGVEYYDGYFYTDEWVRDTMAAWMEHNPTLCQPVIGEAR
jgi:hypothetical protein